MIESLREAFRSGNRGAAWEVELFVRPWGFRLEDIPIEVHLWHGEMDTTAPPAMGRYLARTIPNCRATLCPNEGHLLFDNHMEEILGAVVAQEASASRA